MLFFTIKKKKSDKSFSEKEEIEEQRQEHWKKEHVSSWGKESVHDAGAPLL